MRPPWTCTSAGARITVVGSALVSATEFRAAIPRFNDDGALTSAFSGDGKIIINDPEGFDSNRAVAARIGPNDTIYVGGWVEQLSLAQRGGTPLAML